MIDPAPEAPGMPSDPRRGLLGFVSLGLAVLQSAEAAPLPRRIKGARDWQDRIDAARVDLLAHLADFQAAIVRGPR